ncbi:MAG TPA: squalene/phytoene synthase family protein [Acetobacteraceae bacterium]|nr:squalene/phytoene synthase family protein [Acetobacteraceae bacterium]
MRVRAIRATSCGMDATLAALVRRHDPDRFLTALFAPPERRDALLTLYAFNHELARAREVASEPTLALIRLQWWREVVDGAVRQHEVATPLAAAIHSGTLQRVDLHALIEAREIEAEPEIATLDEWRAYVLAGAGGLAVAAARLLGAPEPEALRPLGAAYGVAGLLRSVTVLAARGRCLLPVKLLAAQGVPVEAAISAPDAPPVRAVLTRVAEEGRVLLRQGKAARVPRGAIAAALPAVLARRDLARWPRLAPAPRGIGDKLAVTIAGLRGRV